MLNIIVVILILLGLFFFFGTAVGLVHFPDFYSRMHAAGKGDTLSTALILTGLALYHFQDFSLDAFFVGGKIMSIVLFIFIASPTATHAIMDAGYESDIQHLSGPDRKNKEKGETK